MMLLTRGCSDYPTPPLSTPHPPFVHPPPPTHNQGTEMAMKVVRQARLELSGGSTPDLLRPPGGVNRHLAHEQ